MDHSPGVHVLKDIQHLGHKLTTSLLATTAHLLDKVEQYSALDILHQDVDQVRASLSLRSYNDTISAKAFNLDNTVMIFEASHDVDLLL